MGTASPSPPLHLSPTRDGPFAFQGEWVHQFLDRSAGAGDLDFVSFYVHASWFVTGEHREYDRDIGHFAQVIPLRNFDPARRGWGVASAWFCGAINSKEIRMWVLWTLNASSISPRFPASMNC